MGRLCCWLLLETALGDWLLAALERYAGMMCVPLAEYQVPDVLDVAAAD